MKADALLREYVGNLSDNDLQYLYIRYQQRLITDIEEIITFLSKDKSVDKWLSTAPDVDDLFEMVDSVGAFVGKELNARERINATGH